MEENKEGYMERKLKDVLGIYYEPLCFIRNARSAGYLYARIPYLPNLK